MSQVSETPEVVYHYTSMATLLRIIESRQFWATNVSCLNDVKEFNHFTSLVHSRRKQYLKDHPESDAEFYSVSSPKPPIATLPCVASFSARADFLPQWRAYCHEGNGVCIGIRTECLRQATVARCTTKPNVINRGPLPLVSFKSVTYLAENDTRLLDSLITKSVESAVSVYARQNEAARIIPKSTWFLEFLRLQASFVKDEAFATEEEHRLIVETRTNTSGYLRYRATRSTLAPYIAVDIPEPIAPQLDLFNRKTTFIKELIVGPCPHPDLSLEAVRSMIDDLGIGVTVRSSKVPFRDW